MLRDSSLFARLITAVITIIFLSSQVALAQPDRAVLNSHMRGEQVVQGNGVAAAIGKAIGALNTNVANSIGNWNESQMYLASADSDFNIEYGTDGMRGKFQRSTKISNKIITPTVAYRMGLALALYTLSNGKNIAEISTDPRPSSPLLYRALVHGIKEMGVEVVPVGEDVVATTPIIQWEVHRNDGAGAAVAISGSHLDAESNGIKLLAFNGEKIPEQWERITEEIVNSSNLSEILLKIALSLNIQLSERMVSVIDEDLVLAQPQVASVEDYIAETVVAARPMLALAGVSQGNPINVIFDLANGAANRITQKMIAQLPGVSAEYVNDGSGDKINENCGAEFMDKQRIFPIVLPPAMNLQQAKHKLIAHFDGDADRIVFSVVKLDTGEIVRLDGDWIATLEAAVVNKALEILGIRKDLLIGGAQTAYSNLPSRRYQEDVLGVIFDEAEAGTSYVKTGDKYVRENLDRRLNAGEIAIGVGFEPAGHGFLLFSQKAKDTISLLKPSTPEQANAKAFLEAIIAMQNEAGGDGIRHSLVVLAAVRYFEKYIAGRALVPADFNTDGVFYKTPAKIHMKAEVPNPKAIKTIGGVGTVVTGPAGLVIIVNQLQEELGLNYRFVIRASGTEPIARVYVEGPDVQKATDAARKLKQAIESQPETTQQPHAARAIGEYIAALISAAADCSIEGLAAINENIIPENSLVVLPGALFVGDVNMADIFMLPEIVNKLKSKNSSLVISGLNTSEEIAISGWLGNNNIRFIKSPTAEALFGLAGQSGVDNVYYVVDTYKLKTLSGEYFIPGSNLRIRQFALPAENEYLSLAELINGTFSTENSVKVINAILMQIPDALIPQLQIFNEALQRAIAASV